MKELLERKTFSIPMGLPVSFDQAIEKGHAAVALGNLARGELVEAVKKVLLPALRRAIEEASRAPAPELSERHAAQIGGFQAVKKHLLDGPARSPFQRAATANPEELRTAVLLDAAEDVTGWVYNDRHGIGYSIPYD